MENMNTTPGSSQFIQGGGNTESTPQASDAVARFPRASIFEHESEGDFYCSGDGWVQDAIDSINVKPLPRSSPVAVWDNQWFQAHPDRRTLLRLPAEEEIETLEMEVFKYKAVLATAVRSDNLQTRRLLVWAPRTLLNKHEDIDLGEEIAAQLFEVEVKRVRKTEFEIKLAEYRRCKPDWNFFSREPVKELSARVAGWIDAGMLPEDSLVRLVNEQPVNCSPRVTYKDCSAITFQAWLDKDKRLKERVRLALQESAREREQRELQARLKREEQDRLAAQERKEQEKRDKERARRERIARGKGTFADECVEPLPNNLKLVHERFYLKRSSLDDDETAEATVNAIERCFGILGYVDVNCVQDDKYLGYGFDVEILTTWALADKWLFQADSPLVRGWTLDGVRIERIEGPTVSERFDRRLDWTKGFRNIEAPHQGAYKAGDFAHWAEQAQAREEDFEKLNLLIDVCGGDVKAISTVLCEKSTEPTPQTWLVPGLIPRGTVSMLLGDKKQGKTAMAQQLSVAYTQRENEWLGFELDASRGGFAVYLLGEDSPGEAAKRVKMMTGGGLPYLLQIKPADGTEIDDLLSQFASQKIGLLVVDPCRKYHRGNEDSSDTISDLFTKLEAFARAKDCAVLVLHHLKRNARPKNLDEVALYYRGSSVHLDRPRVTLALRRVGDVTEFGIPAPNGVPQHNFLGSEMFSGVKRLRRDEGTFRHVAIEDEKKPAAIAVEETVAAAVLAAVQRLVSQGERVTRSDKRGLYELKPPELIGLPRAKVRAAIDALIADGGLALDDSGALVLPG